MEDHLAILARYSQSHFSRQPMTMTRLVGILPPFGWHQMDVNSVACWAIEELVEIGVRRDASADAIIRVACRRNELCSRFWHQYHLTFPKLQRYLSNTGFLRSFIPHPRKSLRRPADKVAHLPVADLHNAGMPVDPIRDIHGKERAGDVPRHAHE